jgi:hypothetical protein
MYLIFLIFLLFLVIYFTNLREPFEFFNLNYDITLPKSYNTNTDTTYKINFPLYNSDLNNNTTESIFNNRIKFININNTAYKNSFITTNLIDNANCCLAQKKFDSGNFSYTYKPLKNKECNIDLYELDQNNKLLFDKTNNWSNDMCNNNTSNLGSCRIANSECIDFITQDECINITTEIKTDIEGNHLNNLNNKLSSKTIWSKKTCNDKIL